VPYCSVRKPLTQSFSGLRLRLLLLVGLVCAPLVGLVLHNAGQERRRQMAEWTQRAEEIRQLATREEQKMIGQTRQLLFAVAESSQVRSGNARDCKNLLDQLSESYPHYANLGVMKTNGQLLASTFPLTGPVRQPGRKFLSRVLEARGFTMGDFPAEFVTGQRSFEFGCPVMNPAGEFQAVAFAALDLDLFNRYESEVQSELPKGATWTQIDRGGKILIRYPEPEKWIGQSFPAPALLKTFLSQPNGVVEAADQNGERGFYAFASRPSRLVSAEVISILGIPRNILFAESDRKLARDLTGLGIAATIAIVLGWMGGTFLVLRPIRALVKFSTRLASGDLTARTGLSDRGDELSQLTRSFDRMAQAVQVRELESRRVRDKLQVLSHRLVEVQETERRHIARELHDEIGQSLTVAQLNLQGMLQSSVSDSLEPRLIETLEVIERVLEQVQDISLNLRPSLLDDLGLEAAVRWYTDRQAALMGLQARIRLDPLQDRLEPAIETECFRVAQEALTNMARRARARSVAVELRQLDGLLHLRVHDDGVGFDVVTIREKAVRGASLGLLSMEERATLAGGGVEYKSAPGEGTEVHAWFPLKWRVLQN